MWSSTFECCHQQLPCVSMPHLEFCIFAWLILHVPLSWIVLPIPHIPSAGMSRCFYFVFCWAPFVTHNLALPHAWLFQHGFFWHPRFAHMCNSRMVNIFWVSLACELYWMSNVVWAMRPCCASHDRMVGEAWRNVGWVLTLLDKPCGIVVFAVSNSWEPFEVVNVAIVFKWFILGRTWALG